MPIDRLRVRAVALLLVLSLGPFHSVRAEQLSADDALARQLIANERGAWDKYAKRDLQGSRPPMADDYADVQGDGSVLDREGHLAFVPEANVEW